jgi:hypothetical protein
MQVVMVLCGLGIIMRNWGLDNPINAITDLIMVIQDIGDTLNWKILLV